SRQGATFRLDGSQSSDPDGDPLSYVWKDNGVQIAEGAIVEVALSVGQHSITLTVSDGKGGVGVSDPQTVQVLPRPLSVIGASPAKIPQFNTTTMTITGTGFTQGTQVRFDCTSFCQGGSQITVTINSIEEDTIILTARTSQRTPLGNRDCVVTSPDGTTVKLSRSNFVSP
ncbi:MAG: PKD domain-containing protein, partial [Blastocatellia bacterium]